MWRLLSNYQNQLGLVGDNMAKVGTDVMKKQRLGMVRSQLEKFACKHKVLSRFGAI
uniref:Uncharacterized protein n=1 Tax=Zea mays TaxID=4577 RepID=B6TPD2_MAIZE|nr:hypothetical protein [Zea mays]